jgi:hypothetical protein
MTIFVVAVGDGYGRYSLPIILEFCLHNNVRLHVVRENPYDLHPSWLKCLCHKMIDDDFIVCWDLDLLPTKPYTLMEYFDPERINMAQDYIFQIQQPPIFNDNFRFNGGLIGIPKSYSGFFEDIFHNHDKSKEYPSYEQYHLNDKIVETGTQVHELPVELNFAKIWNGVEQDTSRALNIHYTYGHSEMEKFHAIKSHKFENK